MKNRKGGVNYKATNERPANVHLRIRTTKKQVDINRLPAKSTVKPVLNDHSQKDENMVFKTNYR